MRIVPRHVRLQQQAAAIARVIHIVSTVGGDDQVEAKTRRYRNTAADSRVLRMIPVTADGVGGTIPGTDPLGHLIEMEQKALRHTG